MLLIEWIHAIIGKNSIPKSKLINSEGLNFHLDNFNETVMSSSIRTQVSEIPKQGYTLVSVYPVTLT